MHAERLADVLAENFAEYDGGDGRAMYALEAFYRFAWLAVSNGECNDADDDETRWLASFVRRLDSRLTQLNGPRS